MIAKTDTKHRIYFYFLGALWMPLLATLLSPQIGAFVRNTVRDPHSLDQELNRLRQKTPLWNGAIAFYNRALYAVGASGRPGAAEVGRSGWIFLGDVFNNNFSQALGRRTLDDNEVARWTATLGLQGKWLAARHVPYAFVVAPAKWSIYPDRMPWWTHGLQSQRSFDRVLAAAGTLPLIDVRDTLREARNHVDTYSALNSHWTDYGSLTAWTKIATELRRHIPALPTLAVPALKSAAVVDEGNEFAGMLNISASNDWTIYQLQQPLPDYIVVKPDGSEAPMPGGSKTDLLDLPRVIRNDHAGNRLRALILRDSSGNSLSPFLQNAFYMTYQVDHRINNPGTWPNLIGLVEEFRPDLVIWVMTERYFNEPVGDLDYWRNVEAYECAAARGDAWPNPANQRSFTVDGDASLDQPLRLTLAAAAEPQIIRIAVQASAQGVLTFDTAETSVPSPLRLSFGPGRNELFVRLAAASTGTPATLRADPGATVRIEAIEVRSGGAACNRQ